MATHNIEGFSVSHAAILDGATEAEAVGGDIYGVRSASLAADIGNFDNTGDDAVLSSWFWFNFATLTVEGGFIPFDMVALISTVDQAAADAFLTTVEAVEADPEAEPPVEGVNESISMPLYQEGTENSPRRPVLIRMPSKDSDGNVMTLDFVLYSVQFSPINFTGPAYKTGLTVNYTGRAVQSDKDETGTVLDKKAVGRIVATQAVL